MFARNYGMETETRLALRLGNAMVSPSDSKWRPGQIQPVTLHSNKIQSFRSQVVVPKSEVFSCIKLHLILSGNLLILYHHHLGNIKYFSSFFNKFY